MQNLHDQYIYATLTLKYNTSPAAVASAVDKMSADIFVGYLAFKNKIEYR